MDGYGVAEIVVNSLVNVDKKIASTRLAKVNTGSNVSNVVPPTMGD